MSYEINAPVDFINQGEVQVSFTNTLGTQVWSADTASDSLVFGSTSTPNVMQLDPNGTVNTNVLRLRSGALGIKHQADPSLVSNYTYNWPSNPPTGSAQMVTSSGATNVFYDIHAQNAIFVRKNPGPNEYSSVAAAVGAVVAPSDSNRWLIWVYPGIYNEPNFTIPPFTYVVGVSMQNFVMEPSSTGAPFVTFSNNTGLAFATVRNTDPNFPALYFHNVGDYALTHKTEFEFCPRCVLIETDGASLEESQVYLEYMGTTDSLTYAVSVIDSGSSFANFVSIENFFTTGHSDYGISLSGANVELISQSTVMQSDMTGVAFYIQNGARIDLRGTYIEDWDKGIWVPNTPGTPAVLAEGVIYENIITANILIENLSTSGYNDGYTQYSLTKIPYASPFFVANKDQRIVTVAKKGADFTSVAAAVAYITDNGVNARYTVYVGPGVFVEPNIVMKPYVSIVGFYKTQTILIPSSTTGPFITGASYSALSNLMIKGDNPSFAPGVFGSLGIKFDGNPAGVHFRMEDVIFDTFVQLADITSDLGPCIFLMLSPLINVGSRFTKGFTIRDSSSTHDPVYFYVNNLFWNPDAVGLTNFTSLIEVSSSFGLGPQNVYGVIQSSAFGHQPVYPTQGTGVTITGACNVLVTSTAMAGFQTCVLVPNAATQTVLALTSLSCIADNDVDINILNPNATGAINGIIEVDKVFIVNGAAFGVTLNDPNGNIALGGQIYQGETWSLATNITEQIQHASVTGQVDGPLLLATTINPLEISVAAGRGYVFLGPISANYLKYIIWNAAVLTLPANTLSWIYVDGNSNVSSSGSQPSYIQNVILGTVKTDGTGITYIQDIGTNINNLSTQIDETLRDVFGPIVKSGVIGSPGSNLTARQVQISSGQYNLSTLDYMPGSQDPISMIGYYNSGNNQTGLFTDVPLQYDNAGVLTNIPSGQWAKHAIYVLTRLSGTSQYFFVYAQQLYGSESAAASGNLPAPPPFFLGNMCPFTSVVVSGNDTNSQLPLTRFVDIRPTLAFTASSATTTLDHNSLLNLTVGNAHPQYFRVDGTSTMTGDIDLGTQNIIGSGAPNLIFNMDILQHASRHIPGGADPLPTAAPVTISALSNQIGVAASFARSDHLHAHGAQTDPTLHAVATTLNSGFMSSADKTKLDAATSNPTPSTIVMRDANSVISANSLDLYNTAQTYYASIVPSPATFGGPNHTISLPIPVADDILVLQDLGQTLTNKTLTNPNNTLYSRSFFVSPTATVSTDSAGVPTTGQVLFASSTSAAGWQTINNAFLASQGVSLTVANGSGLSGGGAVAPGGTVTLSVNGVSSFTGNRLVLSTPTGFAELSAMTDGQVILGYTGLAPVVGNLSSSTSTISFTSGPGTLSLDLPSVATSGAYAFPSSVTIDSYGRVTSITPGSSGGGTVTSVSLSMPSIFSVTGSPVTTSGTFTVTEANQTAGYFYAGPVSGPASTPSFRPIAATDLPLISLTTGVTGILPIANGGTGISTAPATGQILIGSSGNYTLSNLLGSSNISVTTSLGNTTISLTGTIPISNGGTGALSLTGNSVLYVNPSGTAITGSVLTNGQFLIGSTGNPPSPGLVVGNANRVTSTYSGGNINLDLSTTLQLPGSISFSSSTSVTATGSSQGGAALLPSTYNVVTGGTGGVILPSGATAGYFVTVVNRSGAGINVYPPTSSTIDGGAANAPVVLANGSSMSFEASSSTVWYTVVRGITATSPLVVTNNAGNTNVALSTSLTPNTALYVDSSGAFATAALADGQLLIGSTGLSPVAASLTAGSGITITPGAGSINISTTGAVGVSSVTGTSNQITASPTTGAVILSLPNTVIAPGSLASTSTLTVGTIYQDTPVVTSAAGTTQGTATLITASYTIVTTVTTGSATGVRLPVPPAAGGMVVKITNRSGNAVTALSVYPNTGATIDGLAINTAVTIPNGASAQYEARSATQWYTIQPILTAGTGIGVAYGNGQVTISNTGGTVTSVGLSAPSEFTVTVSPITSTGNLTFVKASQTANTVWAAPNGAAGAPTFRSLVVADLPTSIPNANLQTPSITIITAGGITGGGPVSLGGTITLTGSGGTVTSITAGTGLTGGTITGSGTIALATPVIATNGGTGLSSYAIGDLLVANTVSTLTSLSDVATGNVLLSGGVGVQPSYGKVGLTTHVTGVLPIANGGTNLSTTPTNGQLLIGNGTGYTLSTISATSPISVTNGAGSISLSLGTVPIANGGTNLSTTPTNGQLLIGNGTGYTLAQITAGSGITVTNGAGSINIAATGAVGFTAAIYSLSLSVTSAAVSTFAWFPWASAYSSFSTRTIRFWLEITDGTKGIVLTVTYGSPGTNVLTLTNTTVANSLITTTLAAIPASDTFLSFTVARFGGGIGGANSAIIRGLTLTLS